jgi:6-pyruvoyltetrahydropterin/6-carboxytetrahydropterin synthase
MMFTCTKTYSDIPFAHRAPLHDGHCRWIHGHNWTFIITFAGRRDINGFVMDFGKLKTLRDTFNEAFDHKLLLNENDPLREEIVHFLRLHKLDNVTLVQDCSCEGIAELVYALANALVMKETGGRVSIHGVTVMEDTKNSATYRETVS